MLKKGRNERPHNYKLQIYYTSTQGKTLQMAFKYQPRSQQQIKQQAEQQGSSFEGIVKDTYPNYRYTDGDNWIRILPPTWENPKDFGLEVYTHGFVGPRKATIICPTMNPKLMPLSKCPICEAKERAERRGDTELAVSLKPTKRYIAWVLNKNDISAGPLVCNMPWKVDKEINEQCKDPDTGAYVIIDDPVNGYDIHFNKSGKGKNTSYTGYKLSKNPSTVDETYLEYIAQHPIPKTLRIRSYAEIKALFEGDEPEETETAYGRPVGPPQGNRDGDAGEQVELPRNAPAAEETGDWQNRRHPMEGADDDSDDQAEATPQEGTKTVATTKADALRKALEARRKSA